MKTKARAAILVAVAWLSACTPSTNAIFQTAQNVLRPDAGVSAVPLNPDFRYLRATTDGRVALLVLGYVEPNADGPIQVWYSAEREVLRLLNGRIAGAVGLPTEWRNVTLESPPPWNSLKHAIQTPHWVRHRDVMPGYRFGVRDVLSLRSISPPSRSAIQGLDPEDLAWYEERVENSLRDAKSVDENQLPAARFAVSLDEGGEAVVYSEQCLAPKLCFTLQRWPVASRGVKQLR